MSLEAPPLSLFKIAVLAMGGEGGGVLVDWIVTAAEREGYTAQSTSVPGVAQRTGATIYYVEILTQVRQGGQPPVLALMPTPGDVDVVVASELMEAARAVQRGLVTPDKTFLITSSHRVYTLTEKMAMGDGRVDSDAFRRQCERASRDFVCCDFAAVAEAAGSVISASLFGGLAGTGVLPWPRERYEDVIRSGGIGVAASLKAFDRGFEIARDRLDSTAPSAANKPTLDSRLSTLSARIANDFPIEVAPVLDAGIARTADYQSPDYATAYLNRLEAVCALERAHGDGSFRLMRETARYLALWMTYEDLARVAELKIRQSRFERVRREVGVMSDQIVHINEYFHPRLDEVADTLPVRLGQLLLRSKMLRGMVEPFTKEGRIVRSSSLCGFMLLYSVASLRRIRLMSLRHQRETTELSEWLRCVTEVAPRDYTLACEIAECQRLVKGYGDTHARGMKSFHTIMKMLPRLPAHRAAEWVVKLRVAALADDSGEDLRRLAASIDVERQNVAPDVRPERTDRPHPTKGRTCNLI